MMAALSAFYDFEKNNWPQKKLLINCLIRNSLRKRFGFVKA